MDKKWYVVEQSAEELEVSIVELTKNEAKVVRKFLDNRITVREEDFVGCLSFYDNKPFDTAEDARDAISYGTYYD